MNMNRMAIIANPYQGQTKKVLCVCSAGLLRSPTAAVVLSQEPFNLNTRTAGVSQEYALIPVDDVLLTWADEIVCMEAWHCNEIYKMLHELKTKKKVINLNIEDSFGYRDPILMQMIKDKYSLEIVNERCSAGTRNDGTGHSEEASEANAGSPEVV